jgi:cyclophilin family peptidyl-prolyl cis-trans isomerase
MAYVMNRLLVFHCVLLSLLFAVPGMGAPVIDPISNVNVPAGKSIILPITATSPNGRPLTFTAGSSTNGIAVIVHTNNPFWKMSVVQAAPADAPGAFPTPYRGGTVTVTNIGDMTFMLFRDLAPHTVDVIQGLTAGGFYTGNTIFHRVVPGFVIQGGDPGTNGMGGPVFRYDDEFDPTAIFSGNGQLALANSGKDTDGSQFFVTLGAQRELDFGYTIFGQLLRGFDVLRSCSESPIRVGHTIFGQLLRGFDVLSTVINTPANTNSRPLADVIITRASLVPDNFDTVLTLTGTNRPGVVGTIKVIADDGAGGRATNLFTATTVGDVVNDPPFLKSPAITNLIIPINGSVTNVLSAFDLEGNAIYYGFQKYSFNAINYTSVSSFNGANGQIVITPVPGFSGPFTYSFAVSPTNNFSPYDSQLVTFAVGDTAITASAANFVVPQLVSFTNQLVATFTNGVLNSPGGNFSALINWGDNSTSSGQIVTNQAWKEVRGAHTYTNAGDYPVYVTIQSALGVTATVVATASVPPAVKLTRTGSTNIVRWPAWATAYRLQTNTGLASANWGTLSNFPALDGYDMVATNQTVEGALFFQLRK